MKLAAGFLGAGVAFLVSGVLAWLFGTMTLSHTLWGWMSFLHLMSPQDVFAGSFPDFVTLLLGRLLLLLALLCFILAALFYLLARQHLARQKPKS